MAIVHPPGVTTLDRKLSAATRTLRAATRDLLELKQLVELLTKRVEVLEHSEREAQRR